MLDNLFHTNIAAAAARGRQKMAPNQAACSNVEWSFPAIFLSSDALAQTADLTHRLKGYIPSLEAMLRSLPAMAVAGYFPRPIAEKSIQQWLTSSEPGLRAVEGPKFVGKTTTVREACRAAIKNAILTENMAMRPILYVDMDGRLVPDDADALFAILRSRMAEATPAMGPMLYPMIPLARGADGANVNFGLAQLLGLIDSNLILILDNFNPTTKLWEEFLKQAKALVRSTVIAVVTDASSLQLPAVSKMSVSPLNMDETRQFLEFMRSDLENRAQQIFQETGGLPLLLNFVATQDGTGSGPLSNDFPEEQIKKLIDQLDGNDGSVLFQMAVLENGLSFDLASRFLSNWNEAKISSLVARGLLTTEYRQETRWFRLTEFVREGLLTLPVKARDEIREILAGNFREQISEGDAAEDNIRRLIASPGGRDFIQDMHVLFAAMGATEDLRAVPSLVNEWLFGHGHWEDAYRLWRRVVKTLPFDETLADDWIMLANAAHKLGRPQQACKALRDAKRRSPDAIEMLRMKLLYALIIKDLGAKKHSKKVTSIYDWALSFIDAVLKKPDADMHWLSWQKAITMYNRALHRRYWLRDIPGALSDLESAARQFKALADAQMMAMADCEWAEIQLTVKEGERDWPAIFSKLVNADQALEKEAVPSDRAFCNYQLARYYRRRPTTDQDDKKRQIENAREAYGKAMEQAAIARDLRQQEIAEAGLVEISYFILHDMTDEEASRRLEKVARALENFRGDAWSTRVLRDVLLWRGQLQNGSLEFLNKALQIATSPPLTPQNGTDACRAAWILGQYLTVLAGHGQQGEQERVSVKHAPLLKTWLGNSIDPSRPDQWINQLRGFGHAPGE
jgi:tetratricopeptide (TPR) repeat protein